MSQDNGGWFGLQGLNKKHSENEKVTTYKKPERKGDKSILRKRSGRKKTRE